MNEVILDKPGLFPLTGPLPEIVKTKDAILWKKAKALLPDIRVEEIGLFDERDGRDPVIALKILGQWYKIYQWE